MMDNLLSVVLYPTIVFVLAAVIFIVLDTQQQMKCNPGQKWYENKDLKLDILYLVINTFLKKYMMIFVAIIIWSILLPIFDPKSMSIYVQRSMGPLGKFPFYQQVIIYLIVSDFSMYWLHRLFHHQKLWRYHAVHHSEKQVDWTTAYRFHPVNIMLSPVLTDVVMLNLGITPEVMFFLRPFDAAYSFFVHANLSWTLGYIKYIMATPVFHRWHHASNIEAMSKNFAPTFAFWDVLFGTFYMPENKLPEEYGINDANYPQDLIHQLIYPFKRRNRSTIS